MRQVTTIKVAQSGKKADKSFKVNNKKSFDLPCFNLKK